MSDAKSNSNDSIPVENASSDKKEESKPDDDELDALLDGKYLVL